MDKTKSQEDWSISFISGEKWSNSHFQGAYAGFLIGLAATMWLGIGAQVYKPPSWKPPVSTAGCTVDNTTWSVNTTTTTIMTTTAKAAVDK